MFSSPHSHDAMRRLLKAAVGVSPKSQNPANVPDGSIRRRASGPPSVPKSVSPAVSDSKGSIRT